ncbi:MAG: hypothetical protein LBQ98_05945 [Nitrososphaerota archaeon]|jgi:hypothetical protein|nr:hypothetical protein [Nitrososphaerota archaeon]
MKETLHKAKNAIKDSSIKLKYIYAVLTEIITTRFHIGAEKKQQYVRVN